MLGKMGMLSMPAMVGRTIVKSERDIGITDASREGLGRSEVTNIVITESDVAAIKLGHGIDEASGRGVHDPFDEKRTLQLRERW